MSLMKKTTFVALLFSTTIAGSVLANNVSIPGCSARPADSEAGGVGWQLPPGQGVQRTEAGSIDTASQKTDSEAGGVGWQLPPGQGVQRTEAGSIDTASQKTDSEAGGVGWQLPPGQGVQRTEAGGVGWQLAPGQGVQRTEAEGNATSPPTMVAAADPCQ